MTRNDEVEIVKAISGINHKLNLRDYFAGQALAGIMTNVKQDFGENPHQHIAKICYDYADALLEQRVK